MSNDLIILCDSCGQKNRLSPQKSQADAKCGNCGEYLVVGSFVEKKGKENWHSSFNPQQILSRVDLDNLIERNMIRNDALFDEGHALCIFCGNRRQLGILLNDKSFLCDCCFSEVATIEYPEIYEKLKREYLAATEARNKSFEDFSKKFSYLKETTFAYKLAWLSFGLVFLDIRYLFVTLVLFWVSNSEEKQNQLKWETKKEKWEKQYPEPIQPELRHFHDPKAQLTAKDHKILKIFNNWPGYPPFWNYLREVVLNRDGNHCQVPGCPSRVILHVHHKIPVSQGGEHVPDNLISLCAFHHALEPEEGHERVWGDIKTQFFTIVREHFRHNRASYGTHYVRPHVRRLELTTQEELNEIKNFYSLSCPICGSQDLSCSVNDKVIINCESCSESWVGPKELTEETGPRIAEFLTINRNQGAWKANWGVLSSRKETVFSAISSGSRQRKKYKRKTIKAIANEDKLLCPDCNSPMKLIKPRRGQTWKKFWGCTKYQTTGCRGSRQA